MSSPIASIPEEILVHVLSHIQDPIDIFNASLTCKKWHAILTDDLFWKAACQVFWGKLPLRRLNSESWRSEYLHRWRYWRSWQVKKPTCFQVLRMDPTWGYASDLIVDYNTTKANIVCFQLGVVVSAGLNSGKWYKESLYCVLNGSIFPPSTIFINRSNVAPGFVSHAHMQNLSVYHQNWLAALDDNGGCSLWNMVLMERIGFKETKSFAPSGNINYMKVVDSYLILAYDNGYIAVLEIPLLRLIGYSQVSDHPIDWISYSSRTNSIVFYSRASRKIGIIDPNKAEMSPCFLVELPGFARSMRVQSVDESTFMVCVGDSLGSVLLYVVLKLDDGTFKLDQTSVYSGLFCSIVKVHIDCFQIAAISENGDFCVWEIGSKSVLKGGNCGYEEKRPRSYNRDEIFNISVFHVWEGQICVAYDGVIKYWQFGGSAEAATSENLQSGPPYQMVDEMKEQMSAWHERSRANNIQGMTENELIEYAIMLSLENNESTLETD
ncbi:hypothetical protein ROZALSC1DRAFT_30208 [Rozella allomycis CSF55]|uniref:F-box domain-containing protein n=1 Tax=Rozella allomycis (strain CSF55) TaxID=988480 RepID=A0A075B310_ROZAC|nr:hypothetical protein O9G_000757 [Rozella allomycis CSF55]RKP18049.1 hypothetical protein ROZALSC1DRAFT_30208 [Rozella allomycis CSF55]|eukprot:EPZ35361.1 hypothetical protein O9G_000757 [Rozella allomycis CSF55]